MAHPTSMVPTHYTFYYTSPVPDHVTDIPAACLDEVIENWYSPMHESSLRRHPTVPTLPCGFAVWWTFDTDGSVQQFNMVVMFPPAPPAIVLSPVSNGEDHSSAEDNSAGEDGSSSESNSSEDNSPSGDDNQA
ncbi:hypothetical protein B0A50_00502 [Salinomyces thailandicus]|uniref:Uncharacterized protein n=1 Tax=Salinomyces thailandicus TaxID=706561 RepID=A0A4U0UG89_9PEZI|nr:hypothetical protein B0A50_00502 [Salinomyces thailandica]